MIPWVELDRAPVPGGGEVRLKRRGGEFTIMLGSVELMNSRMIGSEEALARLACEPFAAKARPRILIGGLGMGFTLRAALAILPPGAVVLVSELVPAISAWARGPLAELFGGSLDDPRVTLREGDVGAEIRATRQDPYDAILLDVDNGPDGLTRDENDRLYGPQGLGEARAALRRGGILAVWSVAPDTRFSKRLGQAGFAVDEVAIRVRASGRGARHTIWIARRA